MHRREKRDPDRVQRCSSEIAVCILAIYELCFCKGTCAVKKIPLRLTIKAQNAVIHA